MGNRRIWVEVDTGQSNFGAYLERTNNMFKSLDRPRDEWYAEEQHREPYDWLLAWDDIGDAIEAWLDYDRSARILIVGCGNSPFSSELFARGCARSAPVVLC